MIHVLPIGDDREHVENGTGCWCEPRIEWEDPDTGEAYREALVIHRAADRREVIEEAERIANGKDQAR